LAIGFSGTGGWDEIQLLARFKADSLSRLTTARARLFIFVNVVLDNFAWQVFWQAAATATSTKMFTDDKRTGVVGSHGREWC
jgi:hypothetical protein